MLLVQMSGFPASGKSTLSKIIAKEINGIVIDKDILKSSMLENGLDNDVASKLAYDMSFDLAKFYMADGRNVVLDSPCYYDEIIERGMAITKAFSSSYKFLECSVESFDIIHKRIELRDNMTSQIKSVTKESFEQAKVHSKKPDQNYLQVDSSDLSSIDYEFIYEYLRK